MPELKPNPPVIEMENIAVAALKSPHLIVLDEVNWTVRAGEFWAVVGLQRSGKSDLMAMAAGLMPPDRGRYRLFGSDLASAPEEEQLALRRRIGLVFDGGQLFHHLNVAENVALPIRYHQNLSMDEAMPRVQRLLELTGLLPLADQDPTAISRSWQQRVGLARALALEPEVLLLDSPLTGLDPRDASWWIELLCGISEGRALVDQPPVTLAVTGDDLRPWQDRARQCAILRDKKFIPLGAHPDSKTDDEELKKELL